MDGITLLSISGEILASCLQIVSQEQIRYIIQDIQEKPPIFISGNQVCCYILDLCFSTMANIRNDDVFFVVLQKANISNPMMLFSYISSSTRCITNLSHIRFDFPNIASCGISSLLVLYNSSPYGNIRNFN